MLVEQPGEPAQPAVRGDPDRAGPFAQHPGGAFGVEANDDPEQDRLGLIAGQRRDQRDRLIGGDRRDGLVADVRQAGGQLCQLFDRGGHGRSATVMAQMVKGPVPGDRRRPPAKPRSVAQAGQVAGDVQPSLGGDVLGVVTDERPQVAQQPGLDRHVERRERRFVPMLRCDHRYGQVIHCTPRFLFAAGPFGPRHAKRQQRHTHPIWTVGSNARQQGAAPAPAVTPPARSAPVAASGRMGYIHAS